MKIEYIKKSELKEYALKVPQEFDGEIPVSVSRAVSQSENPYASDDDVLLIVARKERKLMAYIGILPGLIQGDIQKKIFWNTCWWADAEAPAAVGIALLKEFIAIYERNVGFSDLGLQSANILRTLDFDIKQREGLMLRFRSALHQRSLHKMSKGSFSFMFRFLWRIRVFKLADLFLNVFRDTSILKGRADTRVKLKILRELPDENIFEFILNNSASDISSPGKEFIEWMSSYSWLYPPVFDGVNEAKHYYFSSIAEDFYYEWPVLIQNGKLIAVGLLSNRDGVIKTLYTWCKKDVSEEFFFNLTIYLQKNKKNHSLITSNVEYVRFLKKNKKKGIRMTSFVRYYSSGNKDYNHLKMQDGDGDYSFT